MGKQTKKIRKNPNDQRGKHTKKSRIEFKKRITSHKSNHLVCLDCHAPENCFVPTSDNDTLVCTRCGWISNAIIYKNDRSYLDRYTFHSIKRSYYQRRNYFSERMRQFCNTEPRFTIEEENYIRSFFLVFYEEYEGDFSEDYLFKYQFKFLFRSLNHYVPSLYFKTKLERWLQAKTIFFPHVTVGNSKIAQHMKLMYEMVAVMFEVFFKGKQNSSIKNIPKIDIFCLLFLYNISRKTLIKYGWYFLNEDICFQTKAIKKNYAHCKEILDLSNKMCGNKNFQHRYFETISLESYILFFQDQFRFEIPDLQDILDLCYRSKEGFNQYSKYLEFDLMKNKKFI